MGKIIGIDLGTSNSCAAVVDAGQELVIPGTTGNRLTPSVVHFQKEGGVKVGDAALHYRILDPENTIVGIKRFIGRRFNEVVDLARNSAFKVLPGNNGLAVVEIRGREYTPQEISAYILRALKEAAEVFLKEEVTQAVITIPAYFGDRQRQATREAAIMAGLEPVRIINEPTAAALAYGSQTKRDEKIAVFDLGGGTFDITLLEIGDGVFETIAISGDGFLGGDDFDQCLVDWIADEVLLDHGFSLSESPVALEQVRRVATSAKCELSFTNEVSIDIPFLTGGSNRTVPLHLNLSRQRFESICEELFDRMFTPCKRVLADSYERKPSKVILVGAATRMPKIDDVVIRAFGQNPSRVLNPDEAVARGAAIQGSVLRGVTKDVLLLDVTPHSLGLEVYGGEAIKLIERNTTIPTRKSEMFSTSTDNQQTGEINILEGDARRALGNRSLGRLVLDEIPPSPQGLPMIEVTFDIDVNGFCHVSAKNLKTGKESRRIMRAETGLEKADLLDAKRRVAGMELL